MEAVISIRQNNNELVNNLIRTGYIRTKKVEQVFRAVDRADYVLPLDRGKAYRDLAWKHGKLHLSAPCIYGEVMESLSLEPGLSFLNLGSGTGYLSTMAGLILSQHGTNHGIELHDDCLKYAYERLEEFKKKSLALDEFDFCEPNFIQGNCLNVAPSRQYDRVYCGAACPESHEEYIKQFVRVGGILVMPFKDDLHRIRKVGENTWLHFMMIPVSLTTLVVPTAMEQNSFHLPESSPLSLRELCRGNIRNRLRENVWNEHQDLESEQPILTGMTPREFFQILETSVLPIFEEFDEASSDDNDDHEFTHMNWQVNADNGRNDQHSQCAVHTERENALNIEKSLLNEGVNIAESSFNSVEEESESKAQTQSGNINENITSDMYLDTSECNSAMKGDDTSAQRKKVAKRKKTDSQLVENVNLNNEQSSSSLNTNHPDSDIADSTDNVYATNLNLGKILNDICNFSRSDNNHSKEEIAHYINHDALSTYMMQKIHRLPLPFSLKLYLNYNRQL